MGSGNNSLTILANRNSVSFRGRGIEPAVLPVGHIAAEVCTSGLHGAAEATPVGSIAHTIARYSAFFISISLQKSLHIGAIEPAGALLALGVHRCLQARFSGQWLRPSGRNPA